MQIEKSHVDVFRSNGQFTHFNSLNKLLWEPQCCFDSSPRLNDVTLPFIHDHIRMRLPIRLHKNESFAPSLNVEAI